MNEDDNRRDLVPQNQHSDRDRENPAGLLQNALKNLDEAQTKNLSEETARKAIELRLERERANDRFENAGREMNRFAQKASDLDRSQQASDFRMQGNFEGASGHTNIQVSKNTSKVTVIIALVIAILLLLVFMSRR